MLLIVTGCLCFMTSGIDGQIRRRISYEKQREDMVRDYIEREGITNRRVLTAMRTVPRHHFMLPGLRKKSYIDGAWSIGHKQTISPPYIVAYMTATIDPQTNR